MPHEFGQTVGAAETGDDAQPHFGLAETGIRGADAYVASHGNLAASAQGKAVDCSDDGNGEGLDFAEHVGTLLAEGGAFVEAQMGHFADVGSGHKGLFAVAGDDEGACVLRQVVEGIVQFAQNGAVECIERFGSRDGKGGDSSVLFYFKMFVHIVALFVI